MNSKERRIRAKINETLGMLIHLKSMKAKKETIVKIKIFIDELIFENIIFLKNCKAKRFKSIVQTKRFHNDEKKKYSGERYL